jgi:opacity protein-like surface antigen
VECKRVPMWRNMLCFRIAIFAVALVCSGYAYAQVIQAPENREWELTGFVGHSFGADFQLPTPVSGAGQPSAQVVGMKIKPGYLVGARVAQNLGNYWATDLEYSFAAQPVRFTNLSPTIQNLSLNQYIHYLSYNVSYLPLPRSSRWRPYGVAGVGAGFFYLPGSVKKDALDLGLSLRDSWEMVFNFGGGVKYLVMDQFALSLDFKDRLSRLPSYGLPVSASIVNGQYQPGISLHGTFNNAQLSFGFTYQWDEF